jgi:hypothetical protein
MKEDEKYKKILKENEELKSKIIELNQTEIEISKSTIEREKYYQNLEKDIYEKFKDQENEELKILKFFIQKSQEKISNLMDENLKIKVENNELRKNIDNLKHIINNLN